MSATKWGGSRSRAARARLRPLVESGGAVCWRCGRPILPGQSWHAGHVIGREHGGPDSIENLAPEHERCSTSAGGKSGSQHTNEARRIAASLSRQSTPRSPSTPILSTPGGYATPGLPGGLPAGPPDDLPEVVAEPLVLSPIPAGTDLAEAREGARWLSLPLTRQGEQIAGVMQALNAEGLPLYETVGVEAPRRSTKTTAALGTLLGRCLARDGYLVASTAQDGTRASAKLVEVMTVLRHAGFEAAGHRLYFSNGKERILFANGSEWRALPPDPAAFRSAAYDCVLIDEAGELPPEKAAALLAGILPTQDTRPHSQTIVAGTPGETRAGLLWDTLQDLANGAPGVGGCVYAAPDGSTFLDLSDPDAPVLDWGLLLRTHPGISAGLTTAAKVYRRLSKMGVQKWSAEYLCLWPLAAGSGALDVAAWRDCAASEAVRPPDAALAWDADPGGLNGALVAAWRDEAGRACLEVLEAGEGTDWLPGAVQRHQSRAGGAASYDAIGANLEVVERMGRAPYRVRSVPLRFKDTIGAAARIDREVRRRNVEHYDHPALTAAVESAGWRPAGNGRLFLRTPGSCAVVAAGHALWAYDQRSAGAAGSGRRVRTAAAIAQRRATRSA